MIAMRVRTQSGSEEIVHSSRVSGLVATAPGSDPPYFKYGLKSNRFRLSNKGLQRSPNFSNRLRTLPR
jgi:hypothetical protein